MSITKDLLFYVPSKLVPAILAVILVIVLTHSLTPNEYGKYAAVLAIINLSDAFVTSWLRQSILRFYPEYQVKDRTLEFQKNVLVLLVTATVVVFMVLSLVMSALGYHLLQIVLALGVSFAQILFSYLTTLYQSTRLSRDYALVTLIQSIVQLTVAFGLVFIIQGGYFFAVMAVGSGYAGAVFYIFLQRIKTDIHFSLEIRQFDWPLAKKSFSYGLPMSVWFLSFQMLFLANRLIIASLRSYDEAGIYSSAYDLINGSLSLMMTPFLLAAHPIIMQLWAQSQDRTAIEELIQRIVRYLLILCVPIFAFSLIINEELFAVFLGQGFIISGWVVPVLVAAVFCAQFSMYFHKGLEIAERTRSMMSVAMFCAGLNIGLNLLFIGKYGYPTAAVSALLSYLIYTVIVYSLSRRYVRVRLSWGSVARVMTAAAFACISLGIGKHVLTAIVSNLLIWIMISIFFFTCIYLLVLNFLGELTAEKRRLYVLVRRRLWGRGI
jgi:O-antigen/teichoic acid export membrane protein